MQANYYNLNYNIVTNDFNMRPLYITTFVTLSMTFVYSLSIDITPPDAYILNFFDIEFDSNSRASIKKTTKETSKIDYYGYRHVVASGVQMALDECRQRFKWSRWNCPKKTFLDILDRRPMPSNKELALTRALIASGIVLSLIRSCDSIKSDISKESHVYEYRWNGCDEIVRSGFKIAKMYLDSQELSQDEASRIINAHNYEVGRLAVKRHMKRKCKCHGASGACQVTTCWTVVPDMNEVGIYIKHQYKTAAKVGSLTSEETNAESLAEELRSIDPDKLVFIDVSPDYCYENHKLGINGTLGRYCSRAKNLTKGPEVSRIERDSCETLCTKCGYKIERKQMNVEKQCNCRFVYCCSLECEICPHIEDTFKCVRYG